MSVSAPGLKGKLQADMKSALKAKHSIILNTLRLVLSEIKNEEIAQQRDLETTEIEAILRREVRKRQEAVEYYLKGQREDLVDAARQEVAVLESYLPRTLDPMEIEAAIESILGQFEGEPVFGQVMKQVMAATQGRADGKLVSNLVRQTLERRR